MYKDIILKIFIFDVMIGSVLMLFGLYLVLLGIKNIKKAPNPKLFFSFCAGFIWLGILYFYSERILYYDCLTYFKKGDNYVKNKVCKVQSSMYTTHSFIVFGDEEIKCDDGKWYYVRYQHTYLKLIRKGKILKMIYLPNSRVVIKLSPVKDNNSPYINR